MSVHILLDLKLLVLTSKLFTHLHIVSLVLFLIVPETKLRRGLPSPRSRANWKMALEKRLPLWKVAAHDVDKPLWYLGYGSNMRSASMAGRNVTPLATKVVTVPTHYVTFDVFGIPYTEPCYASIEQFPDGESGQLHLVHRGEAPVTVPPLCGIAHHLTSSDFHRLLVTEGSGVVYDVVEVDAYELDDRGRATGASFPAYTLKAKFPQRPSGIPSARYMVSVTVRIVRFEKCASKA